jgi:DNA-binding PadR family transcriptional regulator
MVSPEGARDPAYRRLVKKATVENLWIYILSLLRSGPRYGYEIRDLIRSEYGFEPGKVSAYVVIYKLVKGGYISPRGGGGRGPGPPRKYYEITDRGIELLETGLGFLEETLERLKAPSPPERGRPRRSG